MASTIVTKNSSTASAVPVTGDLTQGELAVNVTDKKLYTKDSGGTVVKIVGGLGNQEANAVAITGGSINGTTIGATTASTGAFTTLSASSTVSGTGFSTYLASPPAIGGTTAAAGSFTTLSASGNTTLSGGTANGVAYLNGSKVVTTGSALTFDGTNLGVGVSSPSAPVDIQSNSGGTGIRVIGRASANAGAIRYFANDNTTQRARIESNDTGLEINSVANLPMYFMVNSSEQMRLTSTGLGIGTSSPAYKLDVAGPVQSSAGYYINGNTNGGYIWVRDNYALRFGTNDTERMRLDSSGNLGLGVTPSAWWSSTKTIQVGAGGVISGRTDTAARNYFASNAYLNSSPAWTYIATNYATRYEQNDGQHQFYTAPSGTAGNAITFTQAMTLDASGNLLVGATSTQGGGASVFSTNSTGANPLQVQNTNNSTPYGAYFNFSAAAPNNATSYFLYCDDSSATQRISLLSNGGLRNYQANDVNLSDRREKTNFAPAGEYLAKICAIPVQTFNYIDQNMEEDAGLTLGVVAQDVQAVAPELVMESNWAKEGKEPKMRLSIYQTDLQYALMKCIQEQQALIQQLTARVSQLESN